MTVATFPAAHTPPPRRRHQLRRPNWKRVVLFVATGLALTLVGLVIVVAVIAHRLDTPKAVPAAWRAPVVLPRSATPAIAPGSLVFDSNRTGNYEIWSMDSTGGGQSRLTTDPTSDSWWARLSPDRRTILFYKTPTGTHDRDYSKTSLWAMAADGTDPVELRPAGLDGWVLQGHAEWSPDGGQLVMFGGSHFSPQIWVTDDLGGRLRAATDRSGNNIDPSWSPDGRTIAFVGCPGPICPPSDHEIYTVDAAGGAATRITNDSLSDYDPYFSHDGRELAWLTKISGGSLSVGTWDIRLIPVTHTGAVVTAAPGARPRRLVNDDNINSKPSWSLDDRTIYFHRAIGSLSGGFQIWAIGENGTNLHQLTAHDTRSNEYPGT